MTFEATIARVTEELTSTFSQLDGLFMLPAHLRAFQPAEGEWCIDEILEHITLTNRFLMITLNQSLDKVLKRVETQPIPDDDTDLDRIVHVSDPDAFAWIRPEHMEPTRTISSDDVRAKLRSQRDECLTILNRIRNGQGALHRVSMSVRNLGKLNMYEWLYFLVQHARRHIVEMYRVHSLDK